MRAACLGFKVVFVIGESLLNGVLGEKLIIAPFILSAQLVQVLLFQFYFYFLPH